MIIDDEEGKPNLTKEYVENARRTQGGSVMREKAVPGTQIERFLGFGSLAVRMVVGSAVDGLTNTLSGQPQSTGISDANAERFAESLCRMRGKYDVSLRLISLKLCKNSWSYESLYHQYNGLLIRLRSESGETSHRF
jgi:hypothetical protein